MKNKLIVLVGSLALMPFVTFAAPPACSTSGDIQFILCKIGQIINTIIPILIALGVVYFIYGVITYVISKDEEAKSRGRDAMIFGIIGLLVIVSIWGLVSILKKTFGLANTEPGTVQIPCIPTVDNPC